MTGSSRFRIYHFPILDSTQEEALRRVHAGEARRGDVIIADEQSQGRGRQGRIWETGESGNLAATLIWQVPDLRRAGDYSLIVGVALMHAVADVLERPDRLRVKWPNDLMLDGVKCAGILLERPEGNWVLIGTGVNVAHAPESRAALKGGMKPGVTACDVLDRYLTAFDVLEKTYLNQGLGPVIAAWMDRAYGLGAPMTMRTGSETFQAVFDGLDETGACRARTPEGKTRLVHAGEVFFPDTASPPAPDLI